MRETLVVRSLRAAFHYWPFMHGRGWLLRLARVLLGNVPVWFDIGGRTFIEGSLDDWVIVWAFMRQHESDAPFQHSLELVQPGKVVFDVGANLGIWSLLAARRGAVVHAFEAAPSLSKRLQRHADLNGLDIAVNPCAVGAATTTTAFYQSGTGNSGASSFRRRHPNDVEIEVPVITLDSYAERKNCGHVHLIKVDVEGAELLVFRGSDRLLSAQSAPVVFFELNQQLCDAFGTSCAEVKQFLIDRGYGIYRWEGSAFAGVAAGEPQGHEDLFALRSGR